MIIKPFHATMALLLAGLLSACGGGGDSAPAAAAPSNTNTLPSEPGAPTFLGNTAQDGMNWINYRRAQLGVAALLANAQIATAAQGHSDYQRINNTVSHDQISGKPGFTGVDLGQRLAAAGYVLGGARAYGEVISATSNNSGFYMAEELITAIYHRFVMFEPRFKEIGTGSASASNGYTYLTADFTANNGYGPGVGAARVVVWPFQNQTAVATNFQSDLESPDPVPNANEVGYPISVHADITAKLTVQSFTVSPRGGTSLPTRLLSSATDTHTAQTVAAIVPLSVLKAATIYDVSFSGAVDGVALSKTWSFTTK
jgi:uncharacterized protein YkwD